MDKKKGMLYEWIEVLQWLHYALTLICIISWHEEVSIKLFSKCYSKELLETMTIS